MDEADASYGRRDYRPHLVPGRTIDISSISKEAGNLMKKGDYRKLLYEVLDFS